MIVVNEERFLTRLSFCSAVSFYLKGMLIHHLEQGVRLVIKRDGPVKEFAVAKSNPASLQLLVTAVHKPTGKKQ